MGQITRTNFGITKTLQLTNAQIKAATGGWGYTIVAPITGFAIIPVLAVLHLHSVADYTGIDAACTIKVQAGSIPLLSPLDESVVGAKVSDLLAASGNSNAIMTQVQVVSGGSTWAVSGYADNHLGVDVDLQLIVNNGGADFGGGNVANFLDVTVFYNAVPIA